MPRKTKGGTSQEACEHLGESIDECGLPHDINGIFNGLADIDETNKTRDMINIYNIYIYITIYVYVYIYIYMIISKLIIGRFGRFGGQNGGDNPGVYITAHHLAGTGYSHGIFGLLIQWEYSKSWDRKPTVSFGAVSNWRIRPQFISIQLGNTIFFKGT